MTLKDRVVLIGVSVILAACGLRGTARPEVPSSSWQASGTIRAYEMRVASELGGRILQVMVSEGDHVGRGDPLVALDATPWELELLTAEAALTTARAEYVALQAKPRPEEVVAARAALAQAEAQRDGARLAWDDAQDLVEKPQELDGQIVEARGQVDLAVQGVEFAKAELARVQLLRDQKAEGTVERQAADLQVKAAEEALAAAESDLDAAQTFLDYLYWIRGEPLGYLAQAHAAEKQYLVAEAGVDVARAQLEDLLSGPSAEELAVAEAKVAQAQAQVDLLRLKVERSTLYSPIAGVVVAQILGIGELAAPAVPILKLADLSHVQLNVYVPENRIGWVALGQEVSVTVDGVPNLVFKGLVTRIGEEPEFTPRNVTTAEERQNTFYAVEIDLPNPEGLLKPGMPADASF